MCSLYIYTLITQNQNIIVQVRVRPSLDYELKHTKDKGIKINGNEIILQNNEAYKFQKVFDENSTQDQIFDQNIPIINQFLNGYSVTILAYGMTTSGKTYTLQRSDGLIPHIFNYIFAQIQNEPDTVIQLQYLQLYNEQLLDLLDTRLNNKKQIEIKQDTISSDVPRIYTTNTKTIQVNNYKEAMNVFLNGTINRKTATTALNQSSSRSHCILSIFLKRSQNGIITKSRLNIADLSGSERLSKSKATDQQFKEMININQGLLCLGNVIRTLSSQEYRSGKQKYVSYRDSKLTYLLSDSLGGSSQCVFIACVSPSQYNYNETVQTIMYAARAKNIVNHIYREIEKVPDTKIDQQILSQVDSLNKKLLQQQLIIKQLQEQMKQNGITPQIDSKLLNEQTELPIQIQEAILKQQSNPEINNQIRSIAESEEQQNNIVFTAQTCRQLYLQLITLIASYCSQQQIDLQQLQQQFSPDQLVNQLPWNVSTQMNLLSFLYCLYQQMNTQQAIAQNNNQFIPDEEEIDKIIDDIDFYNQCRQERVEETNYVKFDQLLPDDLEQIIQNQQSNQLLKQKLQEFQVQQDNNVIVLDGIEESLNGAQFYSEQINYNGNDEQNSYEPDENELSSNQSTTSINELNERLESLQQQLYQRTNNGVVDVNEQAENDTYGKTQTEPIKRKKIIKKIKNTKPKNSV